MKEKTSHDKQKYTLVAPANEVPGLIASCPRCGGEIGLWSGEEETACIFCGHRPFEKEKTNH